MARDSRKIFEEYLVLCAQDGERAALDALIARWQPRLFRHGLRLLRDDAAARDVVQETWLAVMRGLRRLDDPARFGAWAFRILTRRAADLQRGEARRREVEGQVEPRVPDPPPPELDALRAALARLPTARRALLALFYVEGLSVADIAEVLGVPAGTVKSRLFHARKQLRAMLERSVS